MNILSSQLLYEPQSGPTTPPSYAYEAYYINNGTMTSLGTVADLSKTFAPQDEFIITNLFVYEGDLYKNGSKSRSNGNMTYLTGRTTSSGYYGYFIEDGKLYRFTSSLGISQVGSDSDWIKVCGYSGAMFGTDRAFAEKSDGLYYISNTTPALVSNLTGWTKITGYGNTGSANYYGYGIHNGALYYLYANGNGAVQKGSDTTWSDITGSCENGSWYGYGINAGKLYALNGTPSQIGVDTNWTKVSGTSSTSAYSLGLNGGKLYRIANSSATQIGNSADWKNCSGFNHSSCYSLAYDSTALYGILGDGTTTKLMDGEFIYCGGNYSSDAYGVVIRRYIV